MDKHLGASWIKVGYQSKQGDDPAAKGNWYFARKKYDKALEAYDEAVQQAPDQARTSVLYANRALVYLKLENPLLALQETEKGLQLCATNLKLLFRKGESLLLLNRFDEAIEFLDETKKKVKEATTNEEFCKLVTDASRMQTEHKEGKYDLLKMMEEAKKCALLQYHADYYVKDMFEVQKIDDRKGRGLVAVRDIEAGTLLMACKAFAFSEKEEKMSDVVNFATKLGESLYFAPLAKKIDEKLMNNPDLGDEFYKLYAGEKFGFLQQYSYDPCNFYEDVNRSGNIIRLNTFRSAEIFFSRSFEAMGKDGGLWIMPSYFNHSCVDCNCTRYTVGDFMFIRAKNAIRKGEELLLEYVAAMQLFGVRRLALRKYGIKCICRLCEAMRGLSKEILKRLDEISDTVDAIRDRHALTGELSPEDLSILKQLLQEVLQYQPDKATNFLATRIRKALATALLLNSPREAYALMKENFEIFSATDELQWAYTCAKILRSYKWLDDETMAYWVEKTESLAKLLYGDERVAELEHV